MSAELTVKELIQKSILTCPPDMPLAMVAQQMAAERCSSILVMDAGRAVGIWTEHDALKLDFSDPVGSDLPIARFMSSPVATIGIETTINEAAVAFRDMGIRHLLAVDADGTPRGMISQSDIVLNQGIEYFVSMREVASVFSRQVVIMAGATHVPDAIREMRRSQEDAIVVRHGAGGYGILTERDVVRLIGKDCASMHVQDVASFPMLTLPLRASLYQARKVFMEHRVRHLGVIDDAGELVGLVSFSDILANIEHEYVRNLRDALRESEAHLAQSNQRLRSAAKAFETTLEGIMVTDAHHIIESVNPAFTQITGYTADEVLGKKPSVLSSGLHEASFYSSLAQALERTGHWQGEICNRRKDGEAYFLWMTIDVVRDDTGKVTNYVGVFSDFTVRKVAEEQARFNAMHDPLTGLANRALLLQQLQRALPHARRAGKKFAVVFIDLDNFKEINDGFGHHVGDVVLQTVARRLRQDARADDTVARLGGDEFVLLLENLGETRHVAPIMAKLLAKITTPVTVETTEFRPMASIGVAVYPDDGQDPQQLLRNADMAMYAAKERGGGVVCYYADLDVLRPHAAGNA